MRRSSHGSLLLGNLNIAADTFHLKATNFAITRREVTRWVFWSWLASYGRQTWQGAAGHTAMISFSVRWHNARSPADKELRCPCELNFECQDVQRRIHPTRDFHRRHPRSPV